MTDKEINHLNQLASERLRLIQENKDLRKEVQRLEKELKKIENK